jgi:hypothetical protein
VPLHSSAWSGAAPISAARTNTPVRCFMSVIFP